MPLISRIDPKNLVASYEKYAKRYDLSEPENVRKWAIKDMCWDTAGPANTKLRQEIMLLLTGNKVPVAKCGVNALYEVAVKSSLFAGVSNGNSTTVVS